MRAALEQTIEIRVERYLEVEHQGVIPNHHFAAASSECINLYRDGYLLSAVMVSQSVTEGIWKFVLERNQIQPKKLKAGVGKKMERPAVAAVLVKQKIISTECAEAFVRIWLSFRNDVHHTNPRVRQCPFENLQGRTWSIWPLSKGRSSRSHSATEISSQFNRAIEIFKRTVRRQRSFGTPASHEQASDSGLAAHSGDQVYPPKDHGVGADVDDVSAFETRA